MLWRTQVLKGLLLGEDAGSPGFLHGGSHESGHPGLRPYELHGLLIRLHPHGSHDYHHVNVVPAPVDIERSVPEPMSSRLPFCVCSS